ncbi:hypothetical protein Pdw03_0104 [Penicillium digitatum]|uniref:Uncharacterized protein n=1 Tax=Penicillium digitatum TaxID=36651 RepID=A0A7T6XQ66_PENDI|nr:hypothetical protein Pdw03_0104 [Penicillium digitatum]
MEGDTSFPSKSSKSPSNRNSFFNAYLICSSFCAVAGLITGAVSLHKVKELKAFEFSQTIMDLNRTFNSTVYAIADNGTFNPACNEAPIELITGQTSIPGQCVTVTASYTMWVARLAINCVPIAYESANCTGTQRKVGGVTAPDCVVAAGAGELSGKSNSMFESFKLYCF